MPKKGYKQTEEHRQNTSQSLKGNPNLIEATKRAWATKRSHTFTDEHKQRLSESKMGRPLSEAHKQAIRDAWARKRAEKETQNDEGI